MNISIVRAWPRQQPLALAARGTASRYVWHARCHPGVWSKQRALAHHGVVAEGLVARVRRLIDVGPSRHLGRDGRRLSEREDAHSTSTMADAAIAGTCRRCRTNGRRPDGWGVNAANVTSESHLFLCGGGGGGGWGGGDSNGIPNTKYRGNLDAPCWPTQ